MKRIYISGRITGIDYKEAEAFFMNAQEYLEKEYGCEVINPMILVPYVKGKTWEEYMLEDIELLFPCDTIFMLSNWEISKGARIESSIAKEMSKNILFQSALAEEIKH